MAESVPLYVGSQKIKAICGPDREVYQYAADNFVKADRQYRK